MPKKKATTMKRRKPPPKVTIRNNRGAGSSAARGDPGKPDDKQRRELGERMRNLDASHALVGAAAGTIGNGLGVLLAGLGWVSPKATAGVLMGTGAATAAAGYYWDADHVMVAGASMTAAGTWSLAQQYAVDAYEAIEQRTEDKKAASGQKQLAQAKQPAKQRNAQPRLRVVRDDDDSVYDADSLYDADEYDASDYED